MNLGTVPHIVWAIVALVVILGFYALLTELHAPVPKLMDGALILVGTIATLARTDIPPGSDD